ncbi:metal-dependent hydrolase [Enterococcus timonensis]|uniref:metal-dependent hydrolase n=1 Tax=Enterococcus timonensis TaxID=1852364 RepID=UPI0008D90E35|nr:metal-dependent hydrolase [Enterococcus timonensis]
MKIIYHGHATLSVILNDGTRILVDPFFTGNSWSTVKPEEISCDYILATHGHNDHIQDLLPIAKKNKATVIAIAELASWAKKNGAKSHGMNLGGSFEFPFGHIKMVTAQHSSSFTEDGKTIYLGEPAGFILQADGKTIYLAGDTAYFSDMKLLADDFVIDLAVLPIGDNFTMGIKDAVKAAKAVEAKKVLPIHYNTFPAIKQDPEKFAKSLPAGVVSILKAEEELII